MVTEITRLSQNASAEYRVQHTPAGPAAMQQGHCRGCSRVVQGCSRAPAIPAVLLLVSRCMHSCRRSGSNAAVAAVGVCAAAQEPSQKLPFLSFVPDLGALLLPLPWKGDSDGSVPIVAQLKVTETVGVKRSFSEFSSSGAECYSTKIAS